MLIDSPIGKLNILSVAGCQTRVIVEKYKSVFDLGFADSDSLKCQNVFLSHTHADHAAGVWRHAAMQEFMNNRVGHYYAPKVNIGILNDFLNAGMRMNQGTPTEVFVSNVEDSGIVISGGISMHTFNTDHTVPSCGFLGISKTKKLLDIYKECAQNEIISLRNNGIEITKDVENIEFAYSGDTRIEGVVNNSKALSAKVLVMECTHLDETKNVMSTRKTGHIHLDEIVETEKLFKNEMIVLMHFSRKYTAETIIKTIKKKISKEFYERLILVTDSHK